MKRILLLLTMGALFTCPTFAQQTGSTTAPPPGPPPGDHHGLDILSPAERAELKKAHDAAVAADPSLATEDKNLHEQMKAAHDAGGPPSDELKAENKAFREKMDAAMIKADPAVAPIIAKLKAAHKHHEGGDGPPPPPPPAGD